MSAAQPGGTAERIARRLRDRIGRGGGSFAPTDGALTPGGVAEEAADPPEELLAFHERYAVNRLDFSARTPFVRRLREKLLRPLQDLAARQTELNALNARVLSELWNRMALLEATTVSRDSQREALAALSRRLGVVQARLESLAEERHDGEEEVDYSTVSESFRGDEAAIGEHQRRYVSRFTADGPVVDLGCGRGEFLELLREAGIDGRGVDSDPHMVARCRSKGLDVEQEDALAYLRRQRTGSLGGVFAAQLVEHLRPAVVVELVQLSRRALGPGGVLVIETLNPRALITIATFYLDFTHERLYDSDALARLFEGEGFKDVDVELSLPVGDEDRLPRLSDPTSQELRLLDDAFARLNVDLYGDRAYAVAGTAPA